MKKLCSHCNSNRNNNILIFLELIFLLYLIFFFLAAYNLIIAERILIKLISLVRKNFEEAFRILHIFLHCLSSSFERKVL